MLNMAVLQSFISHFLYLTVFLTLLSLIPLYISFFKIWPQNVLELLNLKRWPSKVTPLFPSLKVDLNRGTKSLLVCPPSLGGSIGPPSLDLGLRMRLDVSSILHLTVKFSLLESRLTKRQGVGMQVLRHIPV